VAKHGLRRVGTIDKGAHGKVHGGIHRRGRHRHRAGRKFSKFALDSLVFGSTFMELRRNALGQPLRLETPPAKYTRRGVEEDVYWFVNEWRLRTGSRPGRCST